MQFKSFMEAMKGKQHKLDKNKNGELDAHDFKLLRKEEAEQTDESYDFNRAAISKQRLANLRHSGRKVRGASVANLMRAAGLKEEEMDEQDLDQLDEVLNKDAKASDWIHDFVKSDAPQFSGKSKKERIKMALGAYYGKQNEEVNQVNKTKEDLPFDPPYKKVDGNGTTTDKSGAKHTPMSKAKHLARQAMKSAMKEEYDVDISDEVADQILEAAKQYAGPVNVDKVHSAGQEPHEEKWVAAKKKPVKEQYDEEGNITYAKVSFTEFMEGMTATKVAPGVTRYTGGSYGNAKGAKYGNTDYDKETLDTKDDEGSEEQKRGRGRPAGSKSGARGPRIK